MGRHQAGNALHAVWSARRKRDEAAALIFSVERQSRGARTHARTHLLPKSAAPNPELNIESARVNSGEMTVLGPKAQGLAQGTALHVRAVGVLTCALMTREVRG
jgi:hypothetical protein